MALSPQTRRGLHRRLGVRAILADRPAARLPATRVIGRGLILCLVVVGMGGGAAAGAAPAADQPAPRTGAGDAPATRPATAPATAPAADWTPLFNGKSLEGWKPSGFAGQGEPAVEDGNLILPVGEGLTGVTYAGRAKLPTSDYEITFEAKKLQGSDFFAGLTFPVGDSHASLIVGGWGGAVVGISSLDNEDAAHNQTTSIHRLEKDRWHRIRLRVLKNKIQAWLNDEKVVDVSTEGKKVSVRADIEASTPLGLATWQTRAAIRDVKIRKLDPDPGK